MASYKNQNDLAFNDLLAYVINLPRTWNATVALSHDRNNIAGATVRLDASWDHGQTWTNGIQLSDPTAAIGAAYLSSLVAPQAGETQDRLFGATDFRIVRTDGNGGACKIAAGVTKN